MFGKPDPCGDVTRILAGHTPIPTTTHSFPQGRIFLNVPYVVHSRIDRDRCETAFCQCPPNSDVARDVEIRPPTVDPNDHQRLGRLLRRREHDTAANNIVRRSYKDHLLRKFPRLLVLWAKSQSQSEKKRSHAEKDRSKETEKESFRHVLKLYGRARSLFRCATGILVLELREPSPPIAERFT